MPLVGETKVALRIFGDALVPEEISSLLGAIPNQTYRKGDPMRGLSVRKTGMWSLVAKPRQPGDLDDQVAEIFARATSDLEIWRKLAARYRVDLFCGLFMKESNEGLTLALGTLAAAADRDIQIHLDIYSGLPDSAVDGDKQ